MYVQGSRCCLWSCECRFLYALQAWSAVWMENGDEENGSGVAINNFAVRGVRGSRWSWVSLVEESLGECISAEVVTAAECIVRGELFDLNDGTAMSFTLTLRRKPDRERLVGRLQGAVSPQILPCLERR